MKYDFVPSERSMLLTLQRATHATLHRIATELVDLDMTASEMNALGNLADGQSRTVSQLAAAIGARPTTLTSVLDRLEKRGLIARVARAGDRRSILIELTEPGRATAATIRRTLAELESRAVAGLSPGAIEGFYTVLDALTEEKR
ncbi:MarR family winged helix-turn-helix transcriptional regulator [Nocardia sp. BMG111209]|uniref:MarR family winged helix-turn-helix transcriptional regulator n=1 Tax=Nocardia sp. BMG111209 TaxID=1160137 RepID=UPI00036F6760|nr:MarR family transcriptional regulator [Nocardia sp. BMG111209]